MMAKRTDSVAMAAAFIGMIVFPGGASQADDSLPATGEPSDRVEVKIEPYVWLPAINGDIQIGSVLPKVTVNRSFDDFPSDIDATVSTTATIRKDRIAATADVFYADISAPIEDDIGDRDGSLDHEMFFATVSGSYRAARGDKGHLDLLAGARVWAFDTTVSLEAEDSDEIVSASQSDVWVDPIVGISGQLNLSDRMSLEGYADVGGLMSDDDFTYQFRAALGYSVNDRLDVSIGGRFMGLRHTQGDVSRDLDFSGPAVSAKARF